MSLDENISNFEDFESYYEILPKFIRRTGFFFSIMQIMFYIIFEFYYFYRCISNMHNFNIF